MNSNIYNKENESYLNPLFWVHGEDEEHTRETIKIMHENGIGSFTVEPRPHDNYLGEQWWHELDFILDEAKQRDMKVWIFDDGDYPSGCANGEILKQYPQFRKKFIRIEHIDAMGPMQESSFLVKRWLEDDEHVVAVVAAKKIAEGDELIGETLIDVTRYMTNGILYWDIPDGHWQVFIIIRSLKCAEDHTKNHINPLEKEAVLAFIDMTYEPTYQHLKEHFGNTLQGFFTDEPRFGNYPSYEGRLGIKEMPLPYSDDLIEVLSEAMDEDYVKYLPLLWYDGGELTSKIRYTYMDTVSRLFKQNFSEQIGEWCSDRGVKLIGHVVEENGANARVGYGAGHFFRSTGGFHNGGLDIVYNIMPGYDSGTYRTPFFTVDVDFNHWGLAKMASSSSHIDPKKEGITMCEAFGAYGWQEGLKLMKWITDHLCVRGVNVIVPHAITLREFPDPDCPPHFYAGGNNPQWKDFHVWSDYANRVCHMITDGIHRATAAVLYHAEAEWAGDYEPFNTTVKALAQSHIDCDVVPIDALMDDELTLVRGNKLHIHKENYSVLIIPYAEVLPGFFEKKLVEFIDQGLQVVFVKDTPKKRFIEKQIEAEKIVVRDYEELGEWIIEKDLQDIRVSDQCKDLRHYHYSKDDTEIYFFVNESKNVSVEATVQFKGIGNAVIYDALTNQRYKAKENNGGILLKLEAYESVFVVFEKEAALELEEKISVDDYELGLVLDGEWDVSTVTALEYPNFQKTSVSQLMNISRPEILPEFSGIIRYTKRFDIDISTDDESILHLGQVYETANVWINDVKVGSLICPPYRLTIPKSILKRANNEIVVEVTNTLSKQLNDNMFDKYMPQEPSGLLGPVCIYRV